MITTPKAVNTRTRSTDFEPLDPAIVASLGKPVRSKTTTPAPTEDKIIHDGRHLTIVETAEGDVHAFFQAHLVTPDHLRTIIACYGLEEIDDIEANHHRGSISLTEGYED